MATPRKTAVVIISGVLALGAGLGIATTAYADTTPTPIPSSAPTEIPLPQTEPPVVPGNPGGPMGEDPGGSMGEDPMGEDALVQELSRMLGVDEETVRAGLEELRATYGPEVAAAVQAQLDAAVQNGTLTQEEADAIQKAIEQGLTPAGTR